MPANLLKPPPLLPEAEIALFAPGSAVSRENLDAGIASLENLGFRTRVLLDPSRNFGKSFSFSSDSPENRASALMRAISDPKIAALWAIRGGFGSMELLTGLDFRKIRRLRKSIIGYSDVTALLQAVYARSQLVSFHGAMVAVEWAQLGKVKSARASIEPLLGMLSGRDWRQSYSCYHLRGGSAKGRLLPANLAMLCALLGTPWEVKLDGHILVLEDINEPPYRIHRMLLQLKLCGKLKQLKGVVLGRFSGAEAKWGPSLKSYIGNICQTIFDESRIPVCHGLQFGHAGTNLPLPVGCMASLSRGKLTLLESPVANEH